MLQSQGAEFQGAEYQGAEFQFQQMQPPTKRVKKFETEVRSGPDIDQLKEMQRHDPVAREQWWAFADNYGGGVRDPARHPIAFLHEFQQRFAHGERFQSTRPTLADLIKEGQRKAPSFKEAWLRYCALFGNGFKDPSKHDDAYINGFLDYIGQRGKLAIQSGASHDPSSGLQRAIEMARESQSSSSFGQIKEGSERTSLLQPLPKTDLAATLDRINRIGVGSLSASPAMVAPQQPQWQGYQQFGQDTSAEESYQAAMAMQAAVNLTREQNGHDEFLSDDAQMYAVYAAYAAAAAAQTAEC